MKIYKIIIGILLIGVPITFHADSGNFLLNAPIGTLSVMGGTTSFALHNFKLYSTAGRTEFLTGLVSSADVRISDYFGGIGASGPEVSVEGIMTIIILFGLALYVISAIIDKLAANIAGDILMIGFTAMSLVTFLRCNNFSYVAAYNFGLPIFTIVAGLLAIGGLIHTILEKKK